MFLSQNNLRLEKTFLTVDRLVNGNWQAFRSDSHPSTKFHWLRTNTVRLQLILHIHSLLYLTNFVYSCWGTAPSISHGKFLVCQWTNWLLSVIVGRSRTVLQVCFNQLPFHYRSWQFDSWLLPHLLLRRFETIDWIHILFHWTDFYIHGCVVTITQLYSVLYFTLVLPTCLYTLAIEAVLLFLWGYRYYIVLSLKIRSPLPVWLSPTVIEDFLKILKLWRDYVIHNSNFHRTTYERSTLFPSCLKPTLYSAVQSD